MTQRESYEFRPVSLTSKSSGAYTGAWSYQITAERVRPTRTDEAWIAAKTHASRSGIAIQNLTKGTHWVWFRIDDDDPYVPVPDPVTLLIS